MENKNKLNEIAIAQISKDELSKIKDLEMSFNEKYYIIALEKELD